VIVLAPWPSYTTSALNSGAAALVTLLHGLARIVKHAERLIHSPRDHPHQYNSTVIYAQEELVVTRMIPIMIYWRECRPTYYTLSATHTLGGVLDLALCEDAASAPLRPSSFHLQLHSTAVHVGRLRSVVSPDVDGHVASVAAGLGGSVLGVSDRTTAPDSVRMSAGT